MRNNRQPRPDPAGPLAVGLVTLAVAAGPPTATATERERPNIVQILADDLGWGAVGYNGQSHIKTPNIDRLARDGLIFRRGYAAPVCSPTRESIRTGFHQGHAWTDWNIRWARKGLRARSVSIGDILTRAGYTTATFGKWGFGGSKGTGHVLRRDPVVDNPVTLPTRQGYDAFYGCLDHVRAHTYFMASLWRAADDAPHGVELVPTGNTAASRFEHHAHDLYAARAEAFLRKHAGDEDPFYMQVNYQIPHAPLGQITKIDGWFAAAKQFAAMVTRMDRSVGRLVARLRDPDGDGDRSDSVLENTLIVFSADNGGYYRGSGFFRKRFAVNGTLRGSKGSLYEGGIRVPTIACWPGTIEGGRVSDRPVGIADLLPTFADLAGVRGPAGTDGVSLAPTLTGEGTQRRRPCLAFEARGDWAVIRGDWKLVRTGGETALYHLGRDPAEQENLLAEAETPERQRAIKRQLSKLAADEGVDRGSAIYQARARRRGKDRPEPHVVTFHEWTGGEGARLGEPTQWSGDGPPEPPWCGVVANRGESDRTARVAKEVNTLGIAIRGRRGGRQTVRVERGGLLRGRNEVRVGAGGRLTLAGGAVRTARWVDVLAGGTMGGRGEVAGDVYNRGTVKSDGGIVIDGDYHQLEGGTLRHGMAGDTGLLVVRGEVHAGGTLVVEKGNKDRDRVDVLDAKTIHGSFETVELPELDRGKRWDRSGLYETGVIRVRP